MSNPYSDAFSGLGEAIIVLFVLLVVTVVVLVVQLIWAPGWDFWQYPVCVVGGFILGRLTP